MECFGEYKILTHLNIISILSKNPITWNFELRSCLHSLIRKTSNLSLMRISKASNLFLTEFTLKCPKNRLLLNFRRKEVTSLKASLLLEFLSELFGPFDFSYCYCCCSICCKIFKVCLTILRHCEVKG